MILVRYWVHTAFGTGALLVPVGLGSSGASSGLHPTLGLRALSRAKLPFPGRFFLIVFRY
jgi:hypothetical protein